MIGSDIVRSAENIRQHYIIERELADRLRHSSREERCAGLYAAVYNELFRRVPDHPQIARKSNPAAQAVHAFRELPLVARFIGPGTNYLEIGAGDCRMALDVAVKVNHVYAIDVSDEITKQIETPANFELIISDGISIPVPAGSIDFAYSNNLMEHLHPDDAESQLENIFTALRPGGAYLCITPNRLLGPTDISSYFDDEPTGFHLKEYTNRELREMFRRIGFTKCKALLTYKGFVIPILLPISPFCVFEHLIELLPRKLRRQLGKKLGAVRFVGFK